MIYLLSDADYFPVRYFKDWYSVECFAKQKELDIVTMYSGKRFKMVDQETGWDVYVIDIIKHIPVEED